MKNKTVTAYSVAIALVLMVAIPMLAFSAKIQLIKMDCEPAWYDARSSAVTSTHAVTGEMLGYAIVAQGADVRFTVIVTTQVSKAEGVLKSTSVARTVPSGFTESEVTRTMAKDPIIIIHSLDTSATAHVKISYCGTGGR